MRRNDKTLTDLKRTNIGSGIGSENGGLETIMVNLETNMMNIKEANWTYLVR